ncbi:MAG TPA: prepilin-type cleavage/methylation domain-containing protein, partial [Planctomycetaceae bacterium]|nr:prepilin-type cleavage/methylation domain-containing protein [Planctomycetaceae bacterium]
MSWQRWISIGLVLGLLLLAFGLIMPAIFQAREAARRSTAKNNLKQIGLA